MANKFWFFGKNYGVNNKKIRGLIVMIKHGSAMLTGLWGCDVNENVFAKIIFLCCSRLSECFALW